MKKDKGRGHFFINLFIVLGVLAALVVSGYFVLDKVIVPKYFGSYGITDMHDLVAMVRTLYNSPDEEDMLSNPYTTYDQRTAVTKLINMGFPTKSATELDYMAIADGADFTIKGGEVFSDKEIASILDQMLKDDSRILASKLPNIKYLDTININVLELIITPPVIDEVDGQKVYDDESAKISFTFKLDTSAVRSQMASAMDTPLFLLNMIVPKTMYITVNYQIRLGQEGSYVLEDSHVSINGRTEKDSDILLNLLIQFIFPPEDEMTIEKLATECGKILVTGMDVLGDVRMYSFGDGTFGVKIL